MLAGLIELVWGAGLLLGIAVAGAIAIAVLHRSPAIGLYLLAAFAAINWEMPVAPALASVAGFTIYLDDAVCVLLVFATVANVVRARLRMNALQVLSSVFFFLLLGSTLSGAATFGLGSAVVEAKSVVFVAVAICWGLSVHWGEISATRLHAILGLSAATLVAVAVAHIAVHGFGAADEFVISGAGEVQTRRPLTAGQALYLVVCTAYLLNMSRNNLARLMGVLAGVTVIVSQQRTAIICLVVALAFLWLRSRVATKLTTILGLAVAAGIVILISSLGSGGSPSGGSALGDSRTYEGRVDGWLALIKQSIDQGPLSVILGQSFGSGYGRFEAAGVWVEYAPHNWYVTMFLRSGVVGLVALAILMIMMLRRAWQAQAAWPVAVVAALFAFGWTYSWTWYVLGVVCVGLSSSSASTATPTNLVSSIPLLPDRQRRSSV